MVLLSSEYVSRGALLLTLMVAGRDRGAGQGQVMRWIDYEPGPNECATE